MRFYLPLFFAVTFPLFAFAAAAPATIITRPGVATPPIKYYFDLSSALSEGVNQGVRVIVSASNSEKTAVHFDSVKLFDQSGATVGTNVASKTDALTANPYGFTFSNFGVAPADLANVAGVQITFMDVGGENPTGKVTVQSVAVSVTRDSGEACVIADPITIVLPPPPPPTIVSIQRARPLVQPGTHGTGDSGSGGGSSTSMGPYYGSNAANNGGGAVMWSNRKNVYADDSANAIAATGSAAQTANLDVTGFGFSSIPMTATINGIVLEIDRGVSPGASAQDTTIQLITGASAIGNNVASGTTWTSAGGVATYGNATNATDFWGAAAASTATVTNATFGVRISALIGTPTQAYIDYIRITVYYTPTGGSVYDSFMDLIHAMAKNLSCRIAPSATCRK